MTKSVHRNRVSWGGGEPEDVRAHTIELAGQRFAAKIRVASYEDEAEGTMDGTCFTRVVLRPRIAFAGEIDAEKLASLHHHAHERCFISSSVSCTVDVEPQR